MLAFFDQAKYHGATHLEHDLVRSSVRHGEVWEVEVSAKVLDRHGAQQFSLGECRADGDQGSRQVPGIPHGAQLFHTLGLYN